MKVSTDLHIHSCLSPCGDEAMTPFDLVGMSLLNGRRLIALTDHNTARNCAAAAVAAAAYGVGFIPGIEVTTSEDIHAVCLFPSVESALEFDAFLYSLLPDIPNRPEIYGRQILYGSDGEPCGEEPRLLITGCGISILELPGVIEGYGGLCYPAHIDREGNGLMSILGSWPAELRVGAAELSPRSLMAAPSAEPGIPEGIRLISASDAHRLQDLPGEGFDLDLESVDFRGLAKLLGA